MLELVQSTRPSSEHRRLGHFGLKKKIKKKKKLYVNQKLWLWVQCIRNIQDLFYGMGPCTFKNVKSFSLTSEIFFT